MKSGSAMLAFAVSTVWVQSGSAQILNVQPSLRGEVREGWSGVITASGNDRAGNSDLSLISASVTVRHRMGLHTTLLLGNGEIGFAKGERIVGRTLEHLRHRWLVWDPWGAEVFAQHSFDEFKRLSLRILGGAGPFVNAIKTERFDLTLGLSYMLEHERLSVDAVFADSGQRVLHHRGSAYVVFGFGLTDILDLIQTVYLQPRFNLPEDYRVLSETALVVHLSKRVKLTAAYAVSFDSRPPEDVDELDRSLTGAVSATF